MLALNQCLGHKSHMSHTVFVEALTPAVEPDGPQSAGVIIASFECEFSGYTPVGRRRQEPGHAVLLAYHGVEEWLAVVPETTTSPRVPVAWIGRVYVRPKVFPVHTP